MSIEMNRRVEDHGISSRMLQDRARQCSATSSTVGWTSPRIFRADNTRRMLCHFSYSSPKLYSLP